LGYSNTSCSPGHEEPFSLRAIPLSFPAGAVPNLDVINDGKEQGCVPELAFTGFLSYSLVDILPPLDATDRNLAEARCFGFTAPGCEPFSGLDLIFVGNAARFGNSVRLYTNTQGQRGAMWLRVSIQFTRGLRVNFNFQMTDSFNGADGIAFGGLGYSGWSIRNSVQIEFDTWWNDFDNSLVNNHVAVLASGRNSSQRRL
jgi:hypothetical protein